MKKVKEFNRSHRRIKIKFPSIRKKKVAVWNPILDDFHGGLFIHGQSLRNVQRAVEQVNTCNRNVCDLFEELRTGNCSICDRMLTKKFPDDYPDDWKFCCSCKCIAEEITKGTLVWYLWDKLTVEKIRNKITLVG